MIMITTTLSIKDSSLIHDWSGPAWVGQPPQTGGKWKEQHLLKAKIGFLQKKSDIWPVFSGVLHSRRTQEPSLTTWRATRDSRNLTTWPPLGILKIENIIMKLKMPTIEITSQQCQPSWSWWRRKIWKKYQKENHRNENYRWTSVHEGSLDFLSNGRSLPQRFPKLSIVAFHL